MSEEIPPKVRRMRDYKRRVANLNLTDEDIRAIFFEKIDKIEMENAERAMNFLSHSGKKENPK